MQDAEHAKAQIERIYRQLGVDKTSGHIEGIMSPDGGITYRVTRSDGLVAIVRGLDLEALQAFEWADLRVSG